MNEMAIKSKTYSASHVANFMLDRAAKEGRPITQMKLLKLVYIAYGWYFALIGRRLFSEPIYAWQHGPVVRSLYDEFKHYGNMPIDGRSIEYDLDKMKISTPRIPSEDKDAQLILDKVWNIYKGYSAWQLREKTHEKDTPWAAVYDEDCRNTQIPDELIGPHFNEKIDAYLDAATA